MGKIIKNGGHELGKVYFCDYWREMYLVEKIHNKNEGNWAVTVLWDTGRRTTHCTRLEKRDYEVPVEKFYEKLEKNMNKYQY